MAKLKSLKYIKGQFAGQTLNFPLVGDVTFAKDGSVEIDDDKVEDFQKITKDSFEFGLVQEEDRELKALLDEANAVQLLTMAGELNMDASVAALSDDMLRKTIYKTMKAKKQQTVDVKKSVKLAKDRAKSKAKREKAKSKEEGQE